MVIAHHEYVVGNAHPAPGVGGGKFEKLGAVDAYWKQTKSQEIDKGRFNVTKNDDDLYVFKVASLRNVAMTPPYFHDGSAYRSRQRLLYRDIVKVPPR